MKLLIVALACFLFHFAKADTNSFQLEISDDKFPRPVVRATTIIGFFNATFSWRIERLLLFDFGSRSSPRFLSGPNLIAIDHSDNHEQYQVQFKMVPVFPYTSYTRYDEDDDEVVTEPSYTVEGKFTKVPLKTQYWYIINGTKHDGAAINKSKLDFTDNVEIFVNAVYYKTKESQDHTNILATAFDFYDTPASLGSELLKMCKNDLSYRVIIECAGEEIEAYEPILQARTVEFKSLLSNGTDRLRIADFAPKVVRKLVEFCNNDSISDFENEETSIFAIAYTYKIPSLMSYSSKQIIDNATVENAISRFKFAHFYKYESLKLWFFNYIIQNFTEVAKTAGFKTLDAELYKPILEELLKKNKIF